MGRGIAGLCALRGHDTRVFDADPDAQRHVRGAVEASWARAVERGKVAAEDADGARKRLRIIERLRDTPRRRLRDRSGPGGARPEAPGVRRARRPLPRGDHPRLQHLLPLDQPDRESDRTAGPRHRHPLLQPGRRDALGRGRPRGRHVGGDGAPDARARRVARQGSRAGQRFAGLRDVPARPRARARSDADGRGGRRASRRHRPRHGARIRPPDGAAEDERPRRARRPPRDRRNALGRARG